MKRSLIPAGTFVLVLLVLAVSMKYYVKYEYRTTMENFLRAEAVYTVSEERTKREYPITDAENRVALAGFLQNTLVLDRSVNGKPKPVPAGSEAYLVQAEEGPALTVSAEDPSLCYIKGRFFTHYFTGGAAVSAYLAELVTGEQHAG